MNLSVKTVGLIVLGMVLVAAVFGAVSAVLDSSDSAFSEQAEQISEGVNCVMENKETASQDCLSIGSSDSGGGSGG